MLEIVLPFIFTNSLELYYYLQAGVQCPLDNCDSEFSNKTVYVRHIGVTHELVLSLMESAEDVSQNQVEDNSTIGSNEEVSKTDSHQDQLIETSVKHEREDDVKSREVSKVAAMMEEVDQSPRTPVDKDKGAEIASVSVQCFPCQENNKTRVFEKKSEFLKHLSLIHYGKQILQKFPYVEGEKCDLCFDSSKKVYIPNKKELHVCHVSIIHQKLFELIPPEIDRQIKDMPSMKKQESGIRPPMSTSTTIPCKYCHEHVSRKEMKEHLIHHKTVISMKQSATGENDLNIVNLKMNNAKN